MNDAIQKELLVWLQGLRGNVTEQAPLVAQNIINYGKYGALFFTIMCVLLLIFSCVMLKKMIIMFAKYTEEDFNSVKTPLSATGGVLSLLSSIIFLILLIVNLRETMLAWFWPRLYILEYLSNLV
jgi:hypothetical protein